MGGFLRYWKPEDYGGDLAAAGRMGPRMSEEQALAGLPGMGGSAGAGAGSGGFPGGDMGERGEHLVQEMLHGVQGPEQLAEGRFGPQRDLIDREYAESERGLMDVLARTGNLGSGYGMESVRRLGGERARTMSGAFQEIMEWAEGQSREDREAALRWLLQLGQGAPRPEQYSSPGNIRPGGGGVNTPGGSTMPTLGQTWLPGSEGEPQPIHW